MAFPPPGSNPEEELFKRLFGSLRIDTDTGTEDKPVFDEVTVDKILQHFSAQRQEQTARLFDPLIAAENLLGGAIRGALKPSEVGATNPHEGAMKGIQRALGDNPTEALLTSFPGGSEPKFASDKFGEPFEVGKTLAPNTPVGAFAIGMGISLAVPGPDIGKAIRYSTVREGAEFVISRSRKLLALPEEGRFQMHTPDGTYDFLTNTSGIFLQAHHPERGIANTYTPSMISQLAPYDKDAAHAAVALSWARADSHEPARWLASGRPTALRTLLASQYADSLATPLKTMAEHPDHADDLIQAVRDADGKLKFILYSPDAPTKRVTVTVPPFKAEEAQALFEHPDYLSGPISMGGKDFLLRQIGPVGLKEGTLKPLTHSELAAIEAGTKQAPQVVLAETGERAKAVILPRVRSSDLASALFYQNIRKAAGEPMLDPKFVQVPLQGLTTEYRHAILEPLFTHPAMRAHRNTTEFLQELLADLEVAGKDSIFYQNARESIINMVVADIAANRSTDLFEPSTTFLVGPAGGIWRQLGSNGFSLAPGIRDTNQGLLRSVSKHPLWNKVVEALDLDDTHIADRITQLPEDLKTSTFYTDFDSGVVADLVGVDNSLLNLIKETFRETTASASILGGTKTASLSEPMLKLVPRPQVVFRVSKDIVSKASLNRPIVKISDWAVFEGTDEGRVLGRLTDPTKTIPDLIEQTLGSEAGKPLIEQLEQNVAKGTLAPSILKPPVEVAPYLINGRGVFTRVVDVPSIAQHFRNWTLNQFPETLRKARKDTAAAASFRQLFGMTPKEFPEAMEKVAAEVRRIARKEPLRFDKMAGVGALLQKGETQGQLSLYYRHKDLVDTLHKAGRKIYPAEARQTIFTVNTAEHISVPLAAGEVPGERELYLWSPEAVAALDADPAKVDKLFDEVAVELPQMQLRRTVSSAELKTILAAQVDDFADKALLDAEGLTIYDPGYLATSYNPRWSPLMWQGTNDLNDVLIIFDVPKGVKGIPVGIMSSDFLAESEVIVQRNIPFRMNRIYEDPKNGWTVIEAEFLLGLGAVGLSAGYLFDNSRRKNFQQNPNKPPLGQEGGLF